MRAKAESGEFQFPAIPCPQDLKLSSYFLVELQFALSENIVNSGKEFI